MSEEIPKSTLINRERADNVCKIGQGADTCSYLALSTDQRSFFCAKGSAIADYINRRRAAGKMNAKADNCSGPPEFKPHEQALST